MIIDLIALLIVGALALLGWRSGFVRQVVHWVALGAAAFLAPNLGLTLIPYVQPHLERFPRLAAPIVALVIALLLLFLVFDIAAVLLHRLVRSSKKDSVVKTVNKVVGAVFGGLKGVMLVVIVGTGLVLLQTPVVKAFPRLKPSIEHSYSLDAVRSFNPLVAVFRDWGKEHLRKQKEAAAGTAASARKKLGAAAKEGVREAGEAGAAAARKAGEEGVERAREGAERVKEGAEEGADRVEEALED